MTIYATDGSINVSVVSQSPSGTTQAPDGSIYVVKSAGAANGSRNGGGGWNVTLVASPSTYYATDGSINVSVSPYQSGSQPVTVVSGSFGPPPSGNYYPWLFF